MPVNLEYLDRIFRHAQILLSSSPSSHARKVYLIGNRLRNSIVMYSHKLIPPKTCILKDLHAEELGS